MLKALEILGFKSFADRTRFEFPPGITVVVGPNGSGKSNIVDAIKWVLGEQSVKSLRGQEMADVIFNGSGTRRAMNSAEITLTLNNSHSLLPIDTAEVHITRRVYRGGEGEYLINRTPGRLRDIRDLLSGTGMGTQAYSVIEQGKVDVLLQSSARDRRAIFEEAAGISRFKARKLEALRRLERVEQNLLRLSDIVEEVENRLRSVRTQAGKARRYKQYTNRLQEVRTQVALVDWRRLSDRLAEHEQELERHGEQRDAMTAAVEAAEAKLLENDQQINEADESIRQSEGGLAANRERIAAAESTIEHERTRSRDLEQQIERHRRQLVAMSAREGDLGQQLQQTVDAVQAAEAEHQRVTLRLAEGERALTELTARLDQARHENQQRRAQYLDQMRRLAELGNRMGALESQIADALAARRSAETRLGDLGTRLATVDAELEQSRRRHEQSSRQRREQEQRTDAAQERLAELQSQQASLREQLGAIRQRHGAAAERAAVLEELERRQEGLSTGTREVLAKARGPEPGPLAGVCGLVADLLSVGLEIAPLIEIALGPTAQYVVVDPDGGLRDHLQAEPHRFGGRVGFLWLGEPGRAVGAAVELEGRPGVLGRADRFVQTEPRFAPLAERLLGRTWLVERLSHAVRLAGSVEPPVSFVTLAGELLAADGSLLVGPQLGVTGLISRRSQLAALRGQLAELKAAIELGQAEAAGQQQQIAQSQQRVRACAAELRRLEEELSERRLEITAAEERRAQLVEQRSGLEEELRVAAARHRSAGAQLAEVSARRKEMESALAEAENQLTALGGQVERLEGQRQARVEQATHLQVELAKSEERLGNLHARLRQFEESRQERRRAVAESREQLGETVRRAEQSRWAILTAESEIAELYLRKEQVAAATVSLVNRREELRQLRAELSAEAQKARAKARKCEEKIHEVELAASEVRLQRAALADRLREDYGIELAEWEHEPTEEEQRRREEVQAEIDDLRRKINNLGNVNLEALDELEELEARHQNLSAQYKDLAAAKSSLEKIINKINSDSRRLFAETLETVRGHFQVLFRDLFGGGHADIVLDQGVDILESGIEIVARPPGKEPRSISLLSGGEKTLTCVALLLAIFRSRPSPFCVLDEVDAALDEANIDRFIQVLQGFLTWTQFIIVTHSKKTMTCANTIYGVTMQESGVSKQVSVRFEDVSENGEISPECLRAAEVEAGADDETSGDEETQAA